MKFIHLDKIYGFGLDELGIDLAIDDENRVWMYEANNGPVTRFYDDKRAVHTIAYAKYIAKNRIVKKGNKSEGMFDSTISTIPFADHKQALGVLVPKVATSELGTQLIERVKDNNSDLFFFTFNDVDYDEMLIKGHFFENGEWVTKIVEYPKVILDRTGYRGDSNADYLFEELEDIPFINTWSERTNRKSEVYNVVAQSKIVDTPLADFEKVTKTRDIFRYIEKYNEVILKSEFGNRGTYFIKRKQNGKYLYIEGKTVKESNELPLRNKLQKMIEKNHFIVQKLPISTDKDGNPFDIHVHMLLSEDWDFVGLTTENVIIDEDKSEIVTTKRDLPVFLKENYEEDEVKIIGNKVRKISTEVAQTLEQVYADVITEISIKLRMDEAGQLILTDINPSSPVTIDNPTKYAEKVTNRFHYLISNEIQN